MNRLISILFSMLLAAALVSASSDDIRTAHNAFDAGNYHDAVRLFQQTLTQNPQDADLYYWLSRCYYELGDADHAVEAAQRAVKLQPGNSLYHQWLGRAYGQKADKQHSFWTARKVRGEFEEAVRLDPANLSARRDLVEFLVEAPGIVGGDKDKAWQEAQAIAARDPVEGDLARATYWLGKKEFGRAEVAYQQVLQSRPQRVEPYLEAADFYRSRNDPGRMEAAVEAGARVQSSDPRLDYYRAVARLQAGNRLGEAERFLKSYLMKVPQRSDYPSHASAREWLGRLYERMGKQEDAANQYRTALQLDPGRKSAREALERVSKQL